MKLRWKLISALVVVVLAATSPAFSAEMKTFRMMPYEKAELEFEIALPDDWVLENDAQLHREPYTPPAIVIGKIARYTHPTGAEHGFVDVSVMRISHEIAAALMFRTHLQSLGYNVINLTAIDDKSASAYYIKKEKNIDYLGYGALHVRKDFAVIASSEISAPADRDAASPYQKSIDSFNLLSPSEKNKGTSP